MKPSWDYDIIIAGGGMVGASLALLLSHYSGGQLRLLIVESFAPAAKTNGSVSTCRADFDARSTALSYGSRLILEPLGVWPGLAKNLSPINSIHVCERARFGSVLMTHDEMNWPALGYVVENTDLGNVLFTALQQKTSIDFLTPASVTSVCPQRQGVVVDIQHNTRVVKKVSAQLAVVADGAGSALRRQLGIVAKTHDYRQTALIANVSTSSAHNNRAFERFTDEGPMALLPLADSEQGDARAALVWTLPAERAQTLSHCNDSDFLAQLQKRFGHRLGQFTRVGQRASYPLALVQACEQIRSAMVVMGNAAHSLHPVAGQGFNLALRDCLHLARISAANQQNGTWLGDISALSHYVSEQQFDQYKTTALSDYLPSIFSHHLWGMSFLRSLGLATLDIIPVAKKHFTRHAAGLHDRGAAYYQHLPEPQKMYDV